LRFSLCALRPPPRRTRAFTLIEIMVVVVIIGVLSAVLLPALGGPLAKRKLSGAAGDLHLAMRHLQEVAVVNRRTCRLLLQPGAGAGSEPGRYAAEFQATELDAEAAFLTLNDAALPATSLPAGVRFGDLQLPPGAADAPGVPPGGAALTFFADGTADAAVVPLTDGRTVWSVVVAPHTGRARLLKGVVEAVPGGREDLDL